MKFKKYFGKIMSIVSGTALLLLISWLLIEKLHYVGMIITAIICLIVGVFIWASGTIEEDNAKWDEENEDEDKL